MIRQERSTISCDPFGRDKKCGSSDGKTSHFLAVEPSGQGGMGGITQRVHCPCGIAAGSIKSYLRERL